MAKQGRKYSGRITLRMPPEVHKDLVELAERMGVDLTGVINMMIRDRLPTYKRRQDDLEKAHGATKPPFRPEVGAAVADLMRTDPTAQRTRILTAWQLGVPLPTIAQDVGVAVSGVETTIREFAKSFPQGVGAVAPNPFNYIIYTGEPGDPLFGPPTPPLEQMVHQLLAGQQRMEQGQDRLERAIRLLGDKELHNQGDST